MTEKVSAVQVDTIMNWPFADESRSYNTRDSAHYARGFGAGLPGDLLAADQRFLEFNDQLAPLYALPMIAVPLADGEFWQQNPATGIVWQKMVHAGEAITVHKPLPACADLILKQKVDKILDRGAERGAVMLQQLTLGDALNDYVTIDVSLVLLANGGFGGPADDRPRDKWVPDDRPADAFVDVLSPRVNSTDEKALFEINAGLAVAAGGSDTQRPLRGVCSFGLAGRAALFLLCDNQPQRLKHFSVKYAGMMFTNETLRIEVWHLDQGRAALRMTALERGQLVLNHCLVEFS